MTFLQPVMPEQVMAESERLRQQIAATAAAQTAMQPQIQGAPCMAQPLDRSAAQPAASCVAS